MATPKLKVKEQFVGLRQTGTHEFEVKNFNVLNLLLNGTVQKTGRFQVCIVVKDIEASAGKFLERVSNELFGKDWMVFVADIGSTDETFEEILNNKFTPQSTLVFKFGNVESTQAMRALNKIADIYKEEYPYRINLVEVNEEPKPSKRIESFCTVATHEMKNEVDLMVKSLRFFHNQPIYILCDKITKDFLEKRGHKNLLFKDNASPEHLEKIKLELENVVKARNTFHRPEAILKKMESMNWALESHDNTFFLDADIVVVDDLQEDIFKDVILSPHYDSRGKCKNGLSYGFFNAGYVFCSDKAFPDYWRKLYLENSSFYEQEGMNYIPIKYDIGLFPKNHNVGFWRGVEQEFKDVKSFHTHFDPKLDFRGNKPLSNMNSIMTSVAKDYIEKNNEELNNYVRSVFGNTSRMDKVAFIHYGKAGGVYINHYMKKFVLTDYDWKVSWYDKMGRDWSKEELQEIIESDGKKKYLHNHHINWDLDSVYRAKGNGWFTFTFLRNPRELLCSIYYWVQRVIKEKGSNPVGVKHFGAASPEYIASMKERGLDLANSKFVSLDVFIRKMVETEDLRRLWTIPKYAKDLDYVAEFRDDNLSRFFELFFCHEYVPQPPRNTSENKGYDYYRENGMIEDSTDSILRSSEGYLEYKDYIDLR
jgi:hypothetical protein